MAEPAELDCLRDQVKLLKRACRHRTMINWKLERIKQEQALSTGFRSSFSALESEAQYMTVSKGAARRYCGAKGIRVQMSSLHVHGR